MAFRVAFGFRAWAWAAAVALVVGSASAAEPPAVKRIAAIVSVYYHNSHADVIVSRLLEGDTLDGQGREIRLKLVSLYIDQTPENDKGRKLAAAHGVPVFDNAAAALRVGGDQLAVDGVLLVCEHGKYPLSETGQTVYPKRRLFGEIVAEFERSGRSVPVFCDKHLADNWQDAKWIYDQAQRLKFPMMAGSTLPTLWRYPPEDLKKDEPLEDVLALSYHTLDTYGFHALEMLQAIVERRRGGETGVRQVECLTGDAVWKALAEKQIDPELLAACASRLQHPSYRAQDLEKRVKEPILWRIDYADGLRAQVLTLNHAVTEWSIAWRRKSDRGVQSTLFWTQEARPFMHFSIMLAGVEKMMHTGQATWPVERTLMTSGLLNALMISKKDGGKLLATPQLVFSYTCPHVWQQPPAPPKDRPIPGQ